MARNPRLGLSFAVIVAASAAATAMLLYLDPPAGAQDGELVSVAPAAEPGSPMIGPAVGERRPDGLAAHDQTGTARDAASLTGEAGLVVFFNRSVDWCSYCQAQVIELNGRLDEFRARGYGVAVVTTDPVVELTRFAALREIRLPLLSDADFEIINAWGLRDPAFAEGYRRHGVPYPATYVLGPDGVIEAALLVEERLGEERGYRSRIALDDLFEVIDGLPPAEAIASVD